jgi:hypothetical protein
MFYSNLPLMIILQAFDVWSAILSAALLILQTYLASTVFAFQPRSAIYQSFQVQS